MSRRYLLLLLLLLGVLTVMNHAGCARTIILLDRPDYHYQNGLRFLNQGNAEGARLEFEYAVSLNRDFAPAWVGLAIAYGTLGQLDKAVESMKQAQSLQESREKKIP